jgi:hypothetical protein
MIFFPTDFRKKAFKTLSRWQHTNKKAPFFVSAMKKLIQMHAKSEHLRKQQQNNLRNVVEDF